MKQFIASRIFRKMLLLAALIAGTSFITFSESAGAQGGACCFAYCNPIYTYCGQFTYPNELYKNSWHCIVANGGSECEVCNPTC